MQKIVFSILVAFLSFFSFAEDAQATIHVEKIVLGSGCFWGAEKGYEALDGVIDAVSGYADGENVRPTYREITKFSNKFNPKNHAEVVEVTFNKNLISLEELIIHYLESHDPTQLNRQGNDLGTQYRSIVLYSDTSQEKTILDLISEYQDLLKKNGYGEIETSVKPLTKFFVAENYHQDYIKKNPNGYCPDHSTGVRFARSDSEPDKNNDLLKKLIIGQYSSFTVSFDPYTGGFSKVADGIFSLSDVAISKKLKNLGDVVEVPKILSETGQTTGQLPSRIISLIKDVGTLDKEASADANSEANIYQKQSILRYNILFQQMVYIVTPLNTEVSVGNVVELKFIGTPEGEDYDRQQSGFYLVKELCHSFDPERSVTSMTVVRDTFGEFAKE